MDYLTEQRGRHFIRNRRTIKKYWALQNGIPLKTRGTHQIRYRRALRKAAMNGESTNFPSKKGVYGFPFPGYPGHQGAHQIRLRRKLRRGDIGPYNGAMMYSVHKRRIPFLRTVGLVGIAGLGLLALKKLL